MIVGHQQRRIGGLEPCACLINAVGKRSGCWVSSTSPLHCYGAAPARLRLESYLLRGWFGVFSTGLDSVAAELRTKGIKAETVGHLAWKTTVASIIKWHASGNSGPLVLVGHSQGANNVIDMARLLQPENIPVDLLVTLAPAGQDPIPGNVVRAINYYNSPGWGAPVTADAGYRGKLTNINLGGDIGIYHMAIDKNPRIQAEIERAIVSVPQPQAQAQAR